MIIANPCSFPKLCLDAFNLFLTWSQLLRFRGGLINDRTIVRLPQCELNEIRQQLAIGIGKRTSRAEPKRLVLPKFQ